MNATYITFGSTNPYQASNGRYCGLFRGRTKVAIRVDYCTADQASRRLMRDCLDESDNYCIADDCSAVLAITSSVDVRDERAYDIIMQHGDMTYYDDGYGWETIALADLDEEEARVTLRDNVLYDETDRLYLYDKFPDLAPVVEDEDEE